MEPEIGFVWVHNKKSIFFGVMKLTGQKDVDTYNLMLQFSKMEPTAH